MPPQNPLAYLSDPVYTEDYGASPPPSRLWLAGAAAAGGLLFLRTGPGRQALSYVAGRASRPSLMERRYLDMRHAFHELSEVVTRALSDKGPSARRRTFAAHTARMEHEFTQDMLRRRSWIGKILGLQPVTLEDVLSHRVPFEFQPFSILQRRTQEQLARGQPPYMLQKPPGELMESWLEALSRRSPDVLQAPIDPLLFRTASGQVVDLRGMGEFGERLLEGLSHFSIPIVGWSPHQLLRIDLRREISERFPFRHIRAGSTQPYLAPEGLREDALLIGSKVVSLTRPERVLGKGFYWAPFGTPLQATAQMLGVTHAQAAERARQRGFIARHLDLGAQDEPSMFGTIRSIWKRRSDPDDPLRLTQDLLSGRRITRNQLRQIGSFLQEEVMPIEDSIFEELQPLIAKAYGSLFPGGKVSLKTEQDLIKTLHRMVSARHRDRGILSSAFGRSLETEWESLAASPSTYFRHITFSRRRLPPIPYGSFPEVAQTPQATRLRYMIQREIIAKLAESVGRDSFELMERYLGSKSVRRLLVESVFASTADLKRTVHLLREDAPVARTFRKMLDRTVREMAPWYAPGVQPASPARVLARQSGGGILMRVWRRPPRIRSLIQALHDPRRRREVLDQTGLFLRQFIAGRHDLEGVTTATLLPYHMMSRLNALFSSVGLGLSAEKLGSAHQIFLNLLFRRYLAGIGIAGYAGYLNWEIQNLTGFSPRQAALDVLAGANVAWAHLTEATGVGALARRMQEVMPGSELFWELPVTSFLDPRWKPDELAEFLREGVAPVRQGRFWQFGSTPFQGSGIAYYWPSWYRRFSVDWEFTDIGWGEREEAYRTWWLPTPRYPASFIRHFITEPYHLEERWGRDRPYPVTGPIPLFANLPILGPLLSATVGRLLKPPRPMFEEDIAAWYAGRSPALGYGPRMDDAGVVAQVSPAGMVTTHRYLDYPAGISLEGVEGELEEAPYGPSHLVGAGPGFQLAAARLRAIHYQRLKEGTYRPQSIPVRARLHDIPALPIDPGSVRRPDDLGLQVGEAFSKATDIMGLYGFLGRTALGLAERPWEDESRLATPERAISLGRWHRELQIGGFPADLSEAVRRFLPAYRHADQSVFINPIRNRMPSWMPGPGAMIDFQHGDPFSMIHHGEYRLPGPGFERMHGLPSIEERLARIVPDPAMRQAVMEHMDRTGISPYELYTPWERFMILADVAPYSSEYEYYSRLLTQNKGLIPADQVKEFQEIKRRVSAYKQRLRFFPYRFRGTELDSERVTVTKLLNRGYFLTEEYPGVPFRLAGIRLAPGEAGEQAMEYLASVLRPGTQVTVRYARDAIRRQGSDQFGSTLAIVQAGGRDLNQELLRRGLARETEATDPAAIHVRFSPTERLIGGLWERFSHLDTPIHTKVLQVRSPLEMYERRDLFGKCLAPDTLIIYEGGIGQISEAEVGDVIYTHLGETASIGQISRNSISKVSKENALYIIEVATVMPFPLKATAEHPILVQRGCTCEMPSRKGRSCRPELPWVACCRFCGQESLQGKPLEWTEAKEIREGDWIAMPRFKFADSPGVIHVKNIISFDTVSKGDNLRVADQICGNRRATRSGPFPKKIELTEEFCRLVGYYLAEGSIISQDGTPTGVAWVCDIKDQDLISDLSSALDNLFGIKPCVIAGQDQSLVVVRAKSRFLAEILEQIAGRNSKKQLSAAFVAGLTRKSAIELIRGYVEGDGCRRTPRRRSDIRVASVCLPLLLQIRHIMTGLGLCPTIERHEFNNTKRPLNRRDQEFMTQTNDSWRLILSGIQADVLAEIMEWREGRKSKRSASCMRADEDFVYLRVLGISKEEYCGDVYDLGIEDNAHSFCTIQGAVHNSWQPWWEPVSSILIPTYQSLIRHSPLVSAGYGYLFGRLLTLASPDRAIGRKAGLFGALFLGASSLVRSVAEAATGRTWIPGRRQKERDIDLYFQALEYLKYRGIYEFAARRALEEEGFDADRFFGDAEAGGRQVKYVRRTLQGIKKDLLLSGSEMSLGQLRHIHNRLLSLGVEPARAEHEQMLQDLHERKLGAGSRQRESVQKALISGINLKLREIGQERHYEPLGPWGQVAIAARQRYESTAFGVDLYGHMGPVMASLSRIERRYFQGFLEAPAFERERILSVVSLPMRRALQARWGMEPDPLPSLESIFSSHFLPSPTSQVWSPSKNLDDLKLRVVDAVGLELTDFGFWPADEKRAERHQAPLLPWNQPNFREVDLKRQIEDVLRGQGLEEVWVEISRSARPGLRMQMDISRDTQAEWESFVRRNPRMALGV